MSVAGMLTADTRDPRFDPPPQLWDELRAQAGLRGDWGWEVLRTQAWCSRTPQFVTVLWDEDGSPRGVVHAAWIGWRTRRRRFASAAGAGRWGGLDIRSPGSGAVPGWWFDEVEGGGCAELLHTYIPAMRRRLGIGFRGVLIRQVPEPGLATIRSAPHYVRGTEAVAALDTAEFADRDEWLATLTSNRRHNLRKIARRMAQDSSIERRFDAASEVDAVRLAELLRFNDLKYQSAARLALPQFSGFLRELVRQPDVLTVRYLDSATGQLIAVGTILDHPRWPIFRTWAALPAEEGGRPNLYFDFYMTMVEWAIATGKEGVILGKRMAEVKTSLGGYLVPQRAAAVPLVPGRN